MQRATAVTRWIVRLAGLTQIVLGLTFWTRRGLSLIPVHMAIGMIVVLGLWTIAGFAARAGARPWLVVLAVLWGLALPVVGITHGRLLPGSLHWIIQVVHLLLGLGALRLAEGLADDVVRRGAPGAVRDPRDGVGRRRLGARGA